MSEPVFAAERLSFRYPGGQRDAIADVSLAVAPGTLCALLGPNGSGKSTLMRLLLGVLRPHAGTVRFEGQPLRAWQRRELARRIGVVAQREESAFPMTVRELVGLGRYPYLGAWRRESDADRAAIARALERCEVADLARRSIATLSGGELQRVRIARALAQEPRTLVLDEPTASLDVAHEMAIFELLGALSARDGVTVVIVTHNINLAARYADALLLLDRGAAVAQGTPAAVLERERLEAVYGWPLRVHPYAGPGPDTGAPQVVPVSLHSAGEPRTNRPLSPEQP
jgi:iron complex transport system ATP-binding protein